jgi:hypothetical protein
MKIHQTGRRASLWTVRRRICLYAVLIAIAGIACEGVDYRIDANKINGDLAAKDAAECTTKANQLHCLGKVEFSNGVCHVAGCVDPPDHPTKPVTNCAFGSYYVATPDGPAHDWTDETCKAAAQLAGCTTAARYRFGCFGHSCTNLQCEK